VPRGERATDPAAAVRFRAKAEGFLTAALTAMEVEDWTVAVSNAVQAGICAIDAYMVRRHGVRSAAADHQAAVKLFRSRGGPDIADHAHDLERLIKQKSRAEYGDRLSTQREARDACRRAESLVAWIRAELKGDA
jgi:predicted DNA-binding WGR domain protein